MHTRQAAFLILFCCSVMAFAQKAYLSLSIDPMDGITKVTLPHARVSLLAAEDSVVVDTFKCYKILGDALPRYTYNWEKDGVALPAEYIVRVDCEGYATRYRHLSIASGEVKHGEVTRDLGYLALQRERSQVLGEAVVKASKVMMVMNGDTLVYNASAFQLAEGSMLDELISQLPGVKLEDGGRITVNGHFVSSLLVNGKDFFNGDPNVALQNLPAYMVNKVKAYQKTPDDAYLTRSEEEKDPRPDDPWVLDVVLKRQYAQGWIANMEVAHSVYEADPFLARLFGMRFTDHSRIAAYATGNNINMRGTPQTDSGNWEESMKKEGITKAAEGGMFFSVENKNRKIRYNSTFKAGGEETDLAQFVSATSYLSQTAYAHTTSRSDKRDKSTYVEWSNGLTFVFPKTYIRYWPRLGYSNERRRGWLLSAEGNRLLGRAGLDSLIADGRCGEDFLNLFSTQNLGRTRRWRTDGSADTRISLKSLHLNTLHLQGSYSYNHERAYDMQHYDLLTADGATDRRNRYYHKPVADYKYSTVLDYPLLDQPGTKRTNLLNLTYSYTQQFRSNERMLYRLDELGDEWQPAAASIGRLPSADSLMRCVDMDNSYHRTHLQRRHRTELRWTYRKGRAQISARLPLIVERERLNEWRPSVQQTHRRRQVYMLPQITFATKNLELRFNVERDAPSQTLMFDTRDDSNPLAIYLGNPSLRATDRYYFTAEWHDVKMEKMQQWNLRLSLHTVNNALGQLRLFNPQTGGYTYTPCNIDGNRGLWAAGRFSRPIDGKRHWLVNLGTDVRFNRSADFAATDACADYEKSIVHNLHVSPTVGLDYRRGGWHAAFKASADWERMTSDRQGFRPLSQVDMFYTLSLHAPLPLGVNLDTDLNLFARRGYGDRTMNSDEWVWNADLSRSMDRRKAWLLKLTAHDLLGQLSAVRRDLNAQGRIETRSNTLTRFILLHVIYKFSKKPQKK